MSERSRFYQIARTYILFLSIVLLGAPASRAEILDKVVAVVNDEAITQSEVDSLLYPLYRQFSQIYKTDKEIYENLDKARMDILRQLINDKLIMSVAKKLGMTVSDIEIEERVNMVKEDVKAKGASFEELLKEQRMTLDELKKKYRDMLMLEKTIDREVRRTINIQPSEINTYYQDHIDDYKQPERIAVYGILIKTDGVRTSLESSKLAEDINALAVKGEDFTALALNYSEDFRREEGGDFGFIERGQLLKEIEDVIFALKIGEVSRILETPMGYYTFKAYDRQDEKLVPLEDVHEKVNMALYRSKMQQKFEDWLDSLKSDAYISIK
ncbi:MAG: peptidylprolyl isomerase [Candidatus Omnitrophota bacterium]